MKRNLMKKILLLGLIFLTGSPCFCENKEEQKFETRSVTPTVEEKAEKKIVDGIEIAAYAFSSYDNLLYLGSALEKQGQSALFRYGAVLDSNGFYSEIFNSLVPVEKVKVNDKEVGKSPFFDKAFDFVAPSGPYLATVIKGEKDVYLFDPSTGGQSLLKSEKKLVDAAGDECGSIASLGGSQGVVVIAAVAANGSTGWSDHAGINRGFAVVKKDENKLIQDEHDNESSLGKNKKGATHLNLKADDATSPCTFSGAAGTTAKLGPGIDIHFSARFNTFLIGLSGVVKSVANADMGVLSVMRGTYNDKKLQLAPVLAGINKTIMPETNAGKEIVGFYGATKDLTASTFKVRTMLTTTGHDYLIIVGGVGADENVLKSTVYAVPILPPSHAKAGQLAKSDFSDAVAAAADVIKNDNVAAIVGKSAVAIAPDITGAKTITDIQVDGDTVYVSTETGIYASTAIFKEIIVDTKKKRVIDAWTQWQRVGGQAGAVSAFGFNNTTSDFIYLKGDKKTYWATMWGTSEIVRLGTNEYSQLTSVFEKIFPTAKGGIFKIFDFGPQTPGFAAGCSMIVAVGESTVAIMQMNKDVVTDWGLGKNIFVYSGDQEVVDTVKAYALAIDPTAANSAVLNADLKAIGPLTCAQVLRNAAGNGYLYVGGFNGLARLENSTDAKGWTGLDDVKTKIVDTGFVFKKIAAWDNDLIFSLSDDGKKLQVITSDRVVQTADVTPAAPATSTNISNFDQEYGSEIVTIPRWSGGAQSASAIIFGTTGGLFVSIDNLATQHEVLNVQGFPIKIVYLPLIKDAIKDDKDAPLTKGILFVLAMDRDKDISRVYRFMVDVSGIDVTKILTPLDTLDDGVTLTSWINYPDLRTDFSTDGSVFFSTRYQTQQDPNVLQMRTGGTVASRDTSLHYLLSRTSDFAHMAAPVCDSYSGMWLVPGQLRING